MTSEPRVVIRTEGGPAIGFGHVRRCLSLAQALRERGAGSQFLVNPDAAVQEQIRLAGFEARLIAVKRDSQETLHWCKALHASAVVVDSYDFSVRWLEALEPRKRVVVMIDDLGDRDIPSHVFVVNCTPNAECLPPPDGKSVREWAGPKYALLRQEFAAKPPQRSHHRVERVLITVGGGDPHRLTPRLIEWTRRALGSVQIDVVIGPLVDETLVSRLNGHHGGVTYHRHPSHMRELMLAADLAISAGGQTLYELAATGTPTIAVRLADNQTRNLEGFERAGALVWAGDAADAELEQCVVATVQAVAGDVARRMQLSANGRRMVDGRGAERVATAILSRMRAGAPA